MTAPDTLTEDLLQALAQAARAVPGVYDAVAVARKGLRTNTPTAATGAPTTSAAATGALAIAAAAIGAPVTATDVSSATDVPATDVSAAAAPAAPQGAHPGALPAELDGGPVPVPPGAATTLQEALRSAADLAPDKGTVYITRDHPDQLQTYPQLLDQAEHVLGGLRAAGLRPGDAALFVFADNRAYLTAFWACVLGGFVPTPVAVATTYTAANETNRKLLGAWRLLGHPVLLTDSETAGALAGVRELWGEPDVRILRVQDLAGHQADRAWFPATEATAVLNLLTSGSTGVPKCVQHTHASVTARSHATIAHCGLTDQDVSLIWMPFDHVTVAFYNVRDVFLRALHVNARTEHCLSDPLLWLEWAHRYRATNTWAPNFAFAMVNERADEIAERTWDLSCLREIVNAGEPVIAATSQRFLELLAPHRLPADAITPVWGMSETCSGVTYARQSRTDPTAGTVAIDPASLSTTVRHLERSDRDAVVLSSVGAPIPGVRLRVVDNEGRVLPEDTMGELRITGTTIMAGYFGNEQANAEAYDEQGWFRTGDLAFVTGGQVVIAGRQKDQIIVRGINYMAHELESVVEQVPGVKVTFSAAAGVREPGASTDRLVIFYVPTSWEQDAPAATAEQVRAILVRECGIAPDLLVPVAEGRFPKTASGKIQRAALVADLRAGAFGDHTTPTGPDDNDPGPGPGTATGAGEGEQDAWFFTRQWVQLPAPAADAQHRGPARGGTTLLLAHDADLPHLRLDTALVVAAPAAHFAKDAPDRYRVRATDRVELRRLLAAVAADHGPLSSVVLALPLDRHGEPTDRLTAATAQLTALLAALADGEFGHPQLLVLTAGALYAQPGDRVDLGTCALPGLVRTAVGEVAPLPVRQLDLPADPGAWATALGTELADAGRTGLVAARAGHRWQPKLLPLPEEQDQVAGPVPQPVTAGGLYLVTGGLGGIATDLAAYLLAAFGVRLLLVGRSPAQGERAERLAELSCLGQVLYRQLDIADPNALEQALTEAQQHFGQALDGVLHLAAADPTGGWADLEQHTIVHESAHAYATQYRAKVAGTLALATVLQGRPRARLVLFGSVNGEFGGHSFSAYAAASSFLSGFAEHWHHERGRPVTCIAWSQWSGVGMNRDRTTAAAEHRGYRTIDPDTGLQLFLRALTTPHPYLVAGLDLGNAAIVEELVPQQLRTSEVVLAYVADAADHQALRALVAESARTCPVPVRVTEVPRIPTDAYGAVDTAQLLADTTAHRTRRPSDPPQSDLEHRLALIWADALHRPQVGRSDSFFELGGNSLRAARLLALTDQKLGTKVTTQQLYENPTIAALAAAITRHHT